MTGEAANHRLPPAPVVLLVEDHEPSAAGYAELLTEAGYRVLCANNGYQALAEVSRAAPSLIVLDLKLPKLDGWDLLDRLKGDITVSAIPIVVVTGDSLPSHHDLARSRGAAAVHAKPVHPDDLLASVRDALADTLTSTH
jgi:twitching motility two-component system response regulator PilG